MTTEISVMYGSEKVNGWHQFVSGQDHICSVSNNFKSGCDHFVSGHDHFCNGLDNFPAGIH